jgi:hypothetical protein
MSHHFLSVVYPWWFRLFCRPMGFFFDGSAQSSTMLGWLQGQLRSPHIEITSNSIKDLASRSFWKQSVRLFLEKDYIPLPWWARPQPVVVVVDHAECLLKKHRAEAVNFFYPLVKLANNGPHSIKLIFIVNNEKAVQSLENSLSGSFIVVDCPRVDMEKIEDSLRIKKTLEDCQGRIGYAMRYLKSDQRTNKSAKEFYQDESKWFCNRERLFQPVTDEECTGETSLRKRRTLPKTRGFAPQRKITK